MNYGIHKRNIIMKKKQLKQEKIPGIWDFLYCVTLLHLL